MRGNNLIGTAAPNSGFADRVNNDQVGGAAPINLLLGLLKDNGGQTDTHELLLGSPAVDAGQTFIVSYQVTDQRGLPRVFRGIADIGSFEYQLAPTVANVVISGKVFAPKATVTITDSNGISRSVKTGVFGQYSFEVEPGFYSITAQSKQFTFAPLAVSASKNLANIDFEPTF